MISPDELAMLEATGGPGEREVVARLRPGDLARFWARVDRSGGPGSCWPWTGEHVPPGYGKFYFNGSRRTGGEHMRAHRFALWIATGQEPPADLLVCHTCDNPPCVNPAHLFLGTNADNMADMTAKGRHGYRGRQGSAHHHAKLDEEKVRQIWAMSAAGMTQERIASHFGVTRSCISSVQRGKGWAHVEVTQ